MKQDDLVPGFSWFGKNIGIKDERLDFGGVFSDVICNAAAVFTRNTMPGAPIIVGREHIADGRLQGIIINSKNANVATGTKGVDDSRRICALVAKSCGIAASDILPSSTGVIGQRLPMDKIEAACAEVRSSLGGGIAAFKDFARSILTTDTREKIISIKAGNATILGVAKGAGMVEPNMATMLSYFVTDAEIDSETLRTVLHRVVDRSFNRVSIDSDTSTSDTVVVLANGMAGTVDIDTFEHAFTDAAIYLAREIARDGEGASKLIELTVSGANSQQQALKTAKSIINSPLVKTAVYGADPNWGRFVMAVGKVFEYNVPVSRLRIHFGRNNHRLSIDSQSIEINQVPLDGIRKLLQADEVSIEVVIGTGPHTETVWGCDLTEGYVRENAYYTT